MAPLTPTIAAMCSAAAGQSASTSRTYGARDLARSRGIALKVRSVPRSPVICPTPRGCGMRSAFSRMARMTPAPIPNAQPPVEPRAELAKLQLSTYADIYKHHFDLFIKGLVVYLAIVG